MAIDDYTRELYMPILPDKSAESAAAFLQAQVIVPCPYLIEFVYSDNGTEYKGTLKYSFIKACRANQLTTNTPRLDDLIRISKLERIIRILMEMGTISKNFVIQQHWAQELNDLSTSTIQ